MAGIANDKPHRSTLLEAALSRLSARIAPLVGAQLVTPVTAEVERHLSDKVPELCLRVEAVVAGELLERVQKMLARELPERVGAVLARELPERVEAMLARELPERVEAVLARELPEYGEAVLAGELPERVEAVLARELPERVEAALTVGLQRVDLAGYQFYRPSTVVGVAAGEYMAASNPLARDFLHAEFGEFCRLYNHRLTMHRKLWEWAFIYEHLRRAGTLRSGMRGLCFGVGMEKLPSLFASLGVHITATDAPVPGRWKAFNQYASSKEQLFYPDTISREVYDDRVSFEFCDMNDLAAHLNNYDFCWSSSAFEQLGTLRRGMDFVINSIEQTLKIGGIACHTTELNLSSEDETIETDEVVIFRKKDLEQLCKVLEERGHRVEPLRIEAGTLPADYLVDMPPYRGDPHLKLLHNGYVTTSVALVARRGR